MWNAREGHKEALTLWFEYSVTSGDVLNSHFFTLEPHLCCFSSSQLTHDVAVCAAEWKFFSFSSCRHVTILPQKNSKCSGMQYRRCQKAGRRTLSSSNMLPVSSEALSNHCGSWQESTLPVIELDLCSSGPIVSKRVLLWLYYAALIILHTQEVGAQLMRGRRERKWKAENHSSKTASFDLLSPQQSVVANIVFFLIWKTPLIGCL